MSIANLQVYKFANIGHLFIYKYGSYGNRNGKLINLQKMEPEQLAEDPPTMTKKSIGVILCRINPKNSHPEVLLVHKRYTYAFAEFVHGRYFRYGYYGKYSLCQVIARASVLFSQMTTEELLDIWSLNFDTMWYRIWLSSNSGSEMYKRKLTRFTSTFLGDGGVALREALKNTRSQGSLLWEVPKGRRECPWEADIICATRELQEESGIDKSEYRFIPGALRRESHVSDGVRYIATYYIAVANPSLANVPHERPALRSICDMGEVSDMCWFDIERLRFLNKRIEQLVHPAFRIVKKFNRGRWNVLRAMDKAAAITP